MSFSRQRRDQHRPRGVLCFGGGVRRAFVPADVELTRREAEFLGDLALLLLDGIGQAPGVVPIGGRRGLPCGWRP